MISSETIKQLTLSPSASGKIIMLIVDGLGGLPFDGKEHRLTELEAAHTPNLDRLAAEGATGLIDPIGPGITPGSGLAHLALFGYDPIAHAIGRGAIAAYGIGLQDQFGSGDVAVRCNLAIRDRAAGKIVDRRAGRPATDVTAVLCAAIESHVRLADLDSLTIKAVMDYRAVAILRGTGLSAEVSDSDPGKTGLPLAPFTAIDGSAAAQRTAELAAALTEEIVAVINDPARVSHLIPLEEGQELVFMMRGFATQPTIEPFPELFAVRAASIPSYPDYMGVSRIVGMDVLSQIKDSYDRQVELLEAHWDEYDFFYFHVKKTDSYGEDGNFDGKVHEIETADGFINRIVACRPDVLVVTGDHSTPAQLKAHSWHPVPILFHGPHVRPDTTTAFGETACAGGSLGRFPGTEVMLQALGHARRIEKFGA